MRVFSVKTDKHGMLPEHLDYQVTQAMKQGFMPGFLYAVPDGANPKGTTLPQGRRDDIYAIAVRTHSKSPEGLLILEDVPYHMIRYGDGPFPILMAANDPAGIVIYAVSSSKIALPDKRAGMMHIPMNLHMPDGKTSPLIGQGVEAVAQQTLMNSATTLASWNAQMYDAYGNPVGLWPRSEEILSLIHI